MGPAIQAGTISRDQVEILYDCGRLKTKDPSAGLAANLKALYDLLAKPAGTAAHHDLPVAKEFELGFLQAGLDPNDGAFGRFVGIAKHNGWSNNPGFPPGGPFNQAWRQFFGTPPQSRNASEILQFMHDLRGGMPQTLRKLDGSTVIWTFQ